MVERWQLVQASYHRVIAWQQASLLHSPPENITLAPLFCNIDRVLSSVTNGLCCTGDNQPMCAQLEHIPFSVICIVCYTREHQPFLQNHLSQVVITSSCVEKVQAPAEL